MLSGFNLIIHEASTYEEAISVLDKTPISICIIDIKLPDHNGIELLMDINKRYPSIRSVIFSGRGQVEHVESAFEYNAVDFIEKPSSKAFFTERVSLALKEIELNSAVESLIKAVMVNHCNLCTENEFEKMTCEERVKLIPDVTKSFNKKVEDNSGFEAEYEHSKMNILVVDDDSAIRFIIRRMIEPHGHNVFEAGDGLEGLEVLKSERIDFSIIDLKMPNMNGIEFLREIFKSFPDTISIILTGYADKKSAIDALEYGAYGFLEKPLDKEVLSDTLKDILHELKCLDLNKKFVEDLVVKHLGLSGRNEYLEMSSDDRLDVIKKANDAINRL